MYYVVCQLLKTARWRSLTLNSPPKLLTYEAHKMTDFAIHFTSDVIFFAFCDWEQNQAKL